ncbi:sulfite exporter TauE/SafE family protein [Niabella hibiscisoli]|uniref:sulfite exporter TauE/SafE family protein n=1 Tax=Niabella hibiscisoli TaxID=1825928 RepID=UPI001F0D1D81|nr:sulfite exporter TauE/SafE family protein [Niabella hibiscisoli]MCH5717007.1 sulfite exporter TauE/SafE family protein [Niabella hibiscisoli]
MEIAGYITALLIGLTLGLIGGGGSILTVPILVYLFQVSPVLATSYSLFIVGVTSLVGSVSSFANKKVDIKTVVVFGTLSIITVFCIRHYLIPHLPVFIMINDQEVPVSLVTMLLFAILMIASSFSMIRGEPDKNKTVVHKAGIAKIALYGIAVGLVTGLLGAGGGFLLIPALTVLLRLSIRKAIGTSLVIITLNSLIGFADDVTHHEMDWPLLLKITGISVLGILLGSMLGQKLDGGFLKKGFGWFVLLMGIYILVHELTGIAGL